jgi:hypothetical protein
LKKRAYGANLLLEHEGQLHYAPFNKTKRQLRMKPGPLEHKASFRKDNLTAQQRRLEMLKLLNSPMMMGVVRTQ